ncbi:MAG: lasso peptide biosynthesis B2 protein [Gemmatimonadaceae bacterium]
MLSRLRRLAALPASEWRLALQALGTLAVVRLLLWTIPFGRVRRVVDRWAAAPTAPPDAALARAVRRAVDRAARSAPGSDCLPRALTAELMLRRRGQRVRVSIGIAPDGALLDAHAWTECVGELVTGDSTDIGRYTTLAVFGTDVLIDPGSGRATGGTR